MIDLYTWHTPNGRKVSIMLEEIGMTYNVFPINIAKDEQFQPHFLEVSPNNRIPAIVDKENNNYSLFESGAILMYLAEISGKFINDINLVKAKDSYDKATYEIIDSFSKELSKEKNSINELENILANIKFGLKVIENKEDKIIYINNELKKIIGIPDTEPCINKKYWEIFFNSSFSDVVNVAKKNKSFVKSEISLGGALDKILVVRIGFIDNNKNKMLITLSDVTEIRQMNKIKEELVLNVSHELRTPLSGIIGATELLNSNIGKEDETINKMIDIIVRNSSRLKIKKRVRILKDILVT